MKASVVAALLFTSLTSAWTLDLYGTDGRHETMHGTLGTKCIDIEFTPAIDVKEADFQDNLFVSSFSLYVNKGCNGLSYRNNAGKHALTPARVIRSYIIN